MIYLILLNTIGLVYVIYKLNKKPVIKFTGRNLRRLVKNNYKLGNSSI